MHNTGDTTKCYLVQNVSGSEAEETWIGSKRRGYHRDRDLCQRLRFALCWESGCTQRVMLKMMVVMTTMTTMIPFVHTTVDNGASHSLLHEIQTNWSLFMEDETTAHKSDLFQYLFQAVALVCSPPPSPFWDATI